MRPRMILPPVVLALIGAAVGAQGVRAPESLDVPYEPTPYPVVRAMLKAAEVGPKDVVYDLGCGDGRILVTAVKEFGAARGVGFDLDPLRLREAAQNAKLAGVTDRVKLVQGDIFEACFADATLVTLYLLDSVNLRLRPRLFQQLQPGTRVVSHAFTMGDWEPDQRFRHPQARNQSFMLWVIPAAAGGQWSWTTKVGANDVRFVLTVNQEFQIATGALSIDGGPAIPLRSVGILGRDVNFATNVTVGAAQARITCTGTVDGERITGQQVWTGAETGTKPWAAQRAPVDPVGTWRLTTKPPLASLGQGKLTISRGADGALTAELARTGKPERLAQFYVWGGSLRFDVPVSEESATTYSGLIAGDRMTGAALLPDSSTIEWEAAR